MGGMDFIGGHDYLPEWRDHDIDELHPAFCSVCRALESAGLPVPKGARGLWNLIKKREAEEAAEKKAEQARAELRDAALRKLSKQEREALLS